MTWPKATSRFASVRWTLSTGLATILVVLGLGAVFASTALAETGSINVIGPNANNTLSVQVSITVSAADCSSTNGCAWYGQATAEPASAGCGQYPDQSALVWVESQLQNGPETDNETFNIPMNDFAGTFDLCLYALDPAAGANQLLGQTTYTFPSPTGSASASPQPDGSVAGVVTVDQTLCGENNCPWFASMTEQPGGGACPSTPNSSELVWVGPDEAGIGTFTWQYSFQPDVPAGLIGLCIYIYQGDLSTDQFVGAATVYITPPQSSTPTAPTSTTSPNPGTSSHLPILTLSTAKRYVKTALVRRLGRLSNLTERSCHRLSRPRVRCQVSALTQNRVHWTGTVVIWFSHTAKGVEWNYALTLKSGHHRLVVH